MQFKTISLSVICSKLLITSRFPKVFALKKLRGAQGTMRLLLETLTRYSRVDEERQKYKIICNLPYVYFQTISFSWITLAVLLRLI